MSECRGSGRWTIPGLTYMFKSQLPKRRRFWCVHCHKYEWAHVTGPRGEYVYVFESHRAEGVTKQQWQEATSGTAR